MNRFIVIAGPSCCGKTVLLKGLTSGKFPALADALQLRDVVSWRVLDSSHLDGVELRGNDDVLLHHTFPIVPWDEGRRNPEDTEDRLNILQRGQQLMWITLVISPEALLARLRRRRKTLTAGRIARLRWRSLPEHLTRLRKLEAIYSRPQGLAAAYDRWLVHCERFAAARQVFLDIEDEPTLVDADGMRAAVAAVR